MNARSASMLMMLGLGAVTAAAHADDFASHASFALFAGSNAAMPGSFRGQTVPFDSVDPAGSIVYHDLQFSDAYDHRYTGGVELAYAFNPEVAAYGRFSYAQFDGREQRVGTFMNSADEPQPVMANFGDTHTQEYDLGARYTFMPGSKLRPFVGGSLGATRLGETGAGFAHPDGGGSTKVTLGEADTVFSQRFETGLQFAPLPNFDLRLTAAANHVDADTRSNDPNLALVGLDNTQADVRSHWDYPVELAAVWNFGS
jgi:outer membrane protein with beta-barrel domain